MYHDDMCISQCLPLGLQCILHKGLSLANSIYPVSLHDKTFVDKVNKQVIDLKKLWKTCYIQKYDIKKHISISTSA